MYLPQIGTIAIPSILYPYFQNLKLNSGNAFDITLLEIFTFKCLGMF
jgi:hypothetical protein